MTLSIYPSVKCVRELQPTTLFCSLDDSVNCCSWHIWNNYFKVYVATSLFLHLFDLTNTPMTLRISNITSTPVLLTIMNASLCMQMYVNFRLKFKFICSFYKSNSIDVRTYLLAGTIMSQNAFNGEQTQLITFYFWRALRKMIKNYFAKLCSTDDACG